MKPKNTILHWMRVSGAVLALSFSLAALGNAQSNFVSFDYPGAVHTDATGVSPSRTIVGRYLNADGSQHGFLLAGGKFSPIDYPAAIFTDVTAINPRGDIVGSFVDAANHGHGFVRSRRSGSHRLPRRQQEVSEQRPGRRTTQSFRLPFA